ncbi:MAG: ribosome small subunit-dependent GTPase A [Burkholderiaceae bacterium]|nr:ribosome small subunit-dependent GTPase A [Burkholderiaceae bacterium]
MQSLSPTDSLIGLGLTVPMLQQLTQRERYAGEAVMRVTEVQRDAVCLHDGVREVLARVPPALVERLTNDNLAVGDWVLADEPATGQWRVRERITPLTQIARRTNDGRGAARRQVLVANVDTCLLVMGLDHDFNLRRLERYLALARLAGVTAVVVLTKADAVDEATLARRSEQAREAIGTAVALLALDAREGVAAQLLQPWLGRGQTLVLLGSSGAGKSTLTNTLCGDEQQRTGASRADDGRGRHTTTARTLRRTLAGACVIDTPGLRALRLDADDADVLNVAFDDVATAALRCRFRNCRHREEPGCAVRESLPAERVRNFHKLQREARRDAMNALEQREQRREWKLRVQEGTMRSRAKRG